MAKVNFERIRARIRDQRFGGVHEQDWARCDLALPVYEIRAVACVLDTAPWIAQAVELDCALHVRIDHDTLWIAQERSFHAALGIARRLVTDALQHLRTNAPEPSPEPYLLNAYVSDHRGAMAPLAGGGGTFLMPEGHYGPGFAIEETEDREIKGYFLSSDRYDDSARPLAAALLGRLFPELRIAHWDRLASWGEIDIGADPRTVDALMRHNALRDHAAACHAMASALIARMRSALEDLQWDGAPSVFTTEDDDARNWLLDRMKTGERIKRTWRADAEYDDIDGSFIHTLSDGTLLAPHIVTRLENAGAILPEGYPFDHHRGPDEDPAPLLLSDRMPRAANDPRKDSVPFQAFQSHCAHRRHDYQECVHPTQGGDTCCASVCPLVTQIYAEDVGRYGRGFGDDPAFATDDWERDHEVYAIHPNTRRSYAWKASGEQAVLALVNLLVIDTYSLGIPRRLFGSENMRAVRQAIAEGWLVQEEEITGLGIVARLSERTVAMVDEQVAANENGRKGDAA